MNNPLKYLSFTGCAYYKHRLFLVSINKKPSYSNCIGENYKVNNYKNKKDTIIIKTIKSNGV